MDLEASGKVGNEIDMNDMKVLNQRYETIAWGAIFTLLATLMFIPGDQDNVFLLGIGVILLVLNLARSIKRMTVNLFTTIIGVMALVVGGISVLWPILGIKAHYQVDVFSLIVLAFGLYLLIPGSRKETSD
jgi:hypothetical protein